MTLCHSAAEVSTMSAGEAFPANRINHFHCDLTKRRVFPLRHHSLNHCSLFSVLLFFVLFGFCCITTFHSVVNYSENIDWHWHYSKPDIIYQLNIILFFHHSHPHHEFNLYKQKVTNYSGVTASLPPLHCKHCVLCFINNLQHPNNRNNHYH